MLKKATIAAVLAACFFAGALPSFSADKVFVYSARKEHLIKPLFDAYTEKTGVQIEYVTDKSGPLLTRLKLEGENTLADLLITVDAGNLWKAADFGLLAPVESEVLTANVPDNLRDPGNRWFGLSKRARTIVYSTERVKDGELSTYEALGAPQWQGRLCLRTSKKVYNQSLVAMMIAENGEEETSRVLNSWMENLAAPPFSNDTKVMEAILAGQCDAGIVNTYYFGRLEKKDPQLPLKLFWPDQEGNGVHVNVSGAGVTAHGKNKEAAVKLLEWLSSEEAQNLFADSNMEYPVNKKVAPHNTVAAWGAFNENPLDLSKAGELQVDAIMLMDKAGYK